MSTRPIDEDQTTKDIATAYLLALVLGSLIAFGASIATAPEPDTDNPNDCEGREISSVEVCYGDE